MTAAREIIAALVASGMDALDAAALVARAAVEMSSDRPSKAALRTRKWRAAKPSPTVTGDAPVTPAEPPSQNVTERHQPSQNVTPEIPPLILTSSSDPQKEDSEKKENKKERAPKKRLAVIPDGWQPPERAYALAVEFGVTVPQVDAVFRDYLASSGKLYADYDAAFCNFIRNTRKFNGNGPGKPTNAKSGIIDAADRALANLREIEAADGGAGIGGAETFRLVSQG